MIKIFKKLYCKRHHIPYRLYNEWYNYMAMVKYGLTNRLIDIFNKDNNYINPELYRIVNVLFRTKEGQVTCAYKIVKMRSSSGGDYLYDTDKIHVDLEFVKFVEKISFDEMKERLITLKRQNCMVSDTCEKCSRSIYKDNYCYEISSIIDGLEKED